MEIHKHCLVDVDPFANSERVDHGQGDRQLAPGGLLIIYSHILYIIHEGLYTNSP